jgi:DNA polymerase elongation subunit (family B)
MKHEGYEIQTVYRAVIYKKKSLMFDNIINKLYNERKESPDEVIKYIIKIILNATYGKFSEDIDSTTAYKEKDNGNKEIGHMLLGNGQTEYNYRLLANCGKKPAQIGSFILAYARKIMNKLIRDLGRENILYGDTDSIYCTIESWEYLQKNNEYYNGLNTDLGGFKNDYGDGVLITEAYFLDNKRYFLKFNNTIKGKAYKVKFDQPVEYTNQLIIQLDNFIDCPWHVSNKAIHVFSEKMAVQLVLFSGNIAKFSSAKAKNLKSA